MWAAEALGLAVGYGLDAWLGDPRRWHPVAGYGRAAAWMEHLLYADRRATGTAYTALLVGGSALAAATLTRVSRGSPAARLLLTAAATWTVLGGRSLRAEAAAVAELLSRGDLPAARARIRSLVGRDPDSLDTPAMVRAVVESVAENTSDAVVAPLCWGAVAGLPGLLGYRAVNTLDAMVGHRSSRYRRFGWPAARLDDVVNWLPARLSAALAGCAAAAVGGSPIGAWTVAMRDASRHPSPNAGVVEAAFAGALGVRLGGRNVYRSVVEDRGELGDGPPPELDDIARATRLARLVSALALLCAVAIARLRWDRRSRRDRRRPRDPAGLRWDRR